MTDDERCQESRRVMVIDEAFRRGDLAALRAAVDDPALVPNGEMPLGIGPCLTYAIYHSPLAFIRELLAEDADPNHPADDGFPPLLAAISSGRAAPGATGRTDVEAIVELLLKHGADPNQRGINDWTALHMAVAERNLLVAYRLLRAGADPELRTRIDDFESPIDMARASGLEAFVDLLLARGRPAPRRLRSGVTLLADVPGEGDPVRRQRTCHLRLRLWLHRGDPVIWSAPWGPVGRARLDDGGATLFTSAYVNRGQLMSGLFYGLDGMRTGGLRLLEIAPHLAYGERGVPGVVPPGAVVTAEVTVLG